MIFFSVLLAEERKTESEEVDQGNCHCLYLAVRWCVPIHLPPVALSSHWHNTTVYHSPRSYKSDQSLS